MRRAMILAAGYGKRMRELTQHLPKPLVPVRGKPLIAHSVERLAKAGFKEIVINVSYLANLLEEALGDGSRYNVVIHYSREDEPLEWGGGVLKALPLLGDEPFIVMSGDLWTNYPFAKLKDMPLTALAHLILINESHLHADFSVTGAGQVNRINPAHTYGGIGLFHPELFKHFQPGKHSFCDVVMPAIKKAKVTGEIFDGSWFNIGTPECLNNLCEWLDVIPDEKGVMEQSPVQ